MADASHRAATPRQWLKPVSADADGDIETPSKTLAKFQNEMGRLPMLPGSNMAKYEFSTFQPCSRLQASTGCEHGLVYK